MLPYDVWKQFFPGRFNANLMCTVDRGARLQTYNESEICQLGTCITLISMLSHPSDILFSD